MERELKRVKRALKTLRACNRLLVRATNEKDLLREVCQAIVDVRGYRMAWIGFAEQDIEKRVIPAAQTGYEEGYLEKANITWADTERGGGPSGTAIRTGKPCICRNILVDPNFSPWREEALKRGYASSIALPLGTKGHVFGTLNIYAHEPDAFDEEEVNLLMEVAEDLSYGIKTLRLSAEQEQTRESLSKFEEKLKSSMIETIRALSMTVEARDPYTAGHQQRVSNLACSIAKEMSLSKNQIQGLKMAGDIHDLGKIYVPAEILSKPSRLTDYEFSLVKTHPKVGYDILKTIKFPWPIAGIVYQHHERMNGSGYPKGLSGEEILLEARILAVADVVEAMVSHRPYRPGLGVDKALEEIFQNKGILYDPNIADVCLRLFTEKKYKLE